MKALDALRRMVEQSGCEAKAIGRMIDQPTGVVKAMLEGPGAPSIDQIIAIANALGYELALVDVREVPAYDAYYLSRTSSRRQRKARKRASMLAEPVVFNSDSIDLAAMMRGQGVRDAVKPKKKAKGKKAKAVKIAKGRAQEAPAAGVSARMEERVSPAHEPGADVSVRISEAHPNPYAPGYTPSLKMDANGRIEPDPDAVGSGGVPDALGSPDVPDALSAQHFYMKEPHGGAQSAGSIPAVPGPDMPLPDMPGASEMHLPDMPPMPNIPSMPATASLPMPGMAAAPGMPPMPASALPGMQVAAMRAGVMPGMPTVGMPGMTPAPRPSSAFRQERPEPAPALSYRPERRRPQIGVNYEQAM